MNEKSPKTIKQTTENTIQHPLVESQVDLVVNAQTTEETIKEMANRKLTKLKVEEPEKPLKLRRMEKKKLRVINRLIAGEINGPKAAKLLKLSTRQIRNLKRQVLEEGENGVIHKNRYHKPVNTYDEELRKEIAHIYRVEFRGTNFTEFARIMQERGYDLSRSTIYNILRQNRIRSPQRKRVKRKKTTPKNEVTTKKTTTTTTKKTDSKLSENKKASEKELVYAKK